MPAASARSLKTDPFIVIFTTTLLYLRPSSPTALPNGSAKEKARMVAKLLKGRAIDAVFVGMILVSLGGLVYAFLD